MSLTTKLDFHKKSGFGGPGRGVWGREDRKSGCGNRKVAPGHSPNIICIDFGPNSTFENNVQKLIVSAEMLIFSKSGEERQNVKTRVSGVPEGRFRDGKGGKGGCGTRKVALGHSPNIIFIDFG